MKLKGLELRQGRLAVPVKHTAYGYIVISREILFARYYNVLKTKQ